MSEKISALMDGELAAHEAQAVVGNLLADDELKDAWHAYHLVGEAMRKNPVLGVDVRDAVLLRLADEPTVFSPKSIPHQRPLRRYAAVAASIAFAAAVGWVGWQETQTDLVVAQAVDNEVFNPVSGQGAPYLVAHQEMAAGNALYRVGYGGTRQAVGH